MTLAIPMRWTAAGALVAAEAVTSGVPARISHAAIGDGAYAPDGSETRLVNEVARAPIIRSERSADGKSVTLDVEITPTADTVVRELGFFFEDGTLACVYSAATGGLTPLGAGVTFLLRIALDVSAYGAGAIEIKLAPISDVLTDLSDRIAQISAPLAAIGAETININRRRFDDLQAIEANAAAIAGLTTGANAAAAAAAALSGRVSSLADALARETAARASAEASATATFAAMATQIITLNTHQIQAMAA